ncbi:MAG: hypothetical protein J5762_00025 [Clostridia bacterium]|nr:hypothetical protein [Clostridia bacterium]
MIKFWGKCIKNHRIVKHGTYAVNVDKIDWSMFYGYMSELFRSLDLPTPIVLKAHIFDFAKFNFVKFVPSDFVEPVEFDSFLVELVKDD